MKEDTRITRLRDKLAKSERARKQAEDELKTLRPQVSALMGRDIGLLNLIYRIREAVGDPHGKLMQDELVERCRELHDDRDRLQALYDMECLTHREDLKALAKTQHDRDRYRAHIDRITMASHNVIACAKSEACACGNPACTETADAWAELDASCAAACEDIESK